MCAKVWICFLWLQKNVSKSVWTHRSTCACICACVCVFSFLPELQSHPKCQSLLQVYSFLQSSHQLWQSSWHKGTSKTRSLRQLWSTYTHAHTPTLTVNSFVWSMISEHKQYISRIELLDLEDTIHCESFRWSVRWVIKVSINQTHYKVCKMSTQPVIFLLL